MERSLSTCTDDITTIQGTVGCLFAELVKRENKCEALITLELWGIPEDVNLSTTDSQPDRSHHTLQPKPKPGERPGVVIARLHYYSDCVGFLWKVRESKWIKTHKFLCIPGPTQPVTVLRHVRRQL